MPRIEREATAHWTGNLARGAGSLEAGTGAFDALPYSLPTRFGEADGRTSPEELLAAAHAGCLAMAIAAELTSAGTPPGTVEARCRITLDAVEGRGNLIVASRVDVSVTADGAADGAVSAAIARANAGCTYSNLIRDSGAEVLVVPGV